jgi:hypothetical protein
MSDQPVARPLPTQDNTTQKDADKHPCFEWDSNPRSQQPTGQDPRLRLHGHCDRQQYCYFYLITYISVLLGTSTRLKASLLCCTGLQSLSWYVLNIRWTKQNIVENIHTVCSIRIRIQVLAKSMTSNATDTDSVYTMSGFTYKTGAI